MRLSDLYQREYLEMLEHVAETPSISPRLLTLFWPKIGAQYNNDLLVIGRAVNGWIDEWDLDSPTDLRVLVEAARATGEGRVNDDPLGWILDRWKPGDGGYDTSRSQFWDTVRRIAIDADDARGADWESRIAWTNLSKLAPAAGRNPASRLLALQRQIGPRLLRREVEELSPRKIVAFTGRSWFEPFASELGLEVSWREGFVEGVADEGDRRWVIAVHPMTRSPSGVADAVLSALESRATDSPTR